MNIQQLPTPDTPVLTTLRNDGSRRWLHPRPSEGRLLRRRRLLAYVLIFVFTILPYLQINGKPTILLNIPGREFTLFGFTFLPTDTLLLALLVVSTGRRHLPDHRPIRPRLVRLDVPANRLPRVRLPAAGTTVSEASRVGTTRPAPSQIRSAADCLYFGYLLISMFLAHTFLAYFVGIENLARWVRSSPVEHPAAFVIMAITTGAMMFDFAFFREQTCIVACPYGRFQSVMLDRDSLIVSYDPNRGEPRGKGRRQRDDGTTLGDCIDCGNCVDTCPTGIDIRDGLQLECVACTQCIDACDAVMDKLKKPRGLIRFSSQARIEGQSSRLLRPRVIIYPAIMTVLLIGLSSRPDRKTTGRRHAAARVWQSVRTHRRRDHEPGADQDQEPHRPGRILHRDSRRRRNSEDLRDTEPDPRGRRPIAYRSAEHHRSRKRF